MIARSQADRVGQDDSASGRVVPWDEGRLQGVGDDLLYAGLRIRVERAPGVPPLALPRCLGMPVPAPAGVRALAQVDLSMHRDPGLPRWRPAPRVRAERRPGGDVGIDAGWARCNLAPAGDGFRARADVAVDTLGGAEMDLLQLLAAVVLAERGGALLHAAAVELDGAVCAFLGPSDAGKSTACRHTGERQFAIDRLAVWPGGGRWWAAPVPGGPEDESPLAPSAHAILPLRCLLRVFHGRGAVRAAVVPRARALAYLRPALQWPFGGAAGEVRALDVCEAVSQGVPVGEIHTVLGRQNAPSVRALAPVPGGEGTS
ncbi:MAG: hypothetical protein ACODAU_11765 [Myxococcota bacterium]